MSEFLVGLIAGVLVGIAWRDAYEIIQLARKRSKRRIMDWSKFKPSVVVVILLVAMVQIITGVAMIVQYGRLTGFIDCQARYNQATAETRQERLPKSRDESAALFDVLEAVRSGDQAQIDRRINRAIRAHERYLETQNANPYVAPQQTCGTVGPGSG